VPARDRERAAGRDYAGAVRQAGRDRSADRARVAARPAEVADGGHAPFEVTAAVPERLQCGEGVVADDLAGLGLEVRAAVEAQVDVAVDQAGRERPA
jgi:hypothetical protein